MNVTAKWQLTLGLVAMAALSGSAARAAGSYPAANLRFTIHVHNYASVDSKTMTQAEKVASEIFLKAGVVSQWANEPLPQDSCDAADMQPIGLSQLWVSILPATMADRMNMPAGVTGLAPGAGPDRKLAYIFYNRVKELQRRQIEASSQLAIPVPASAESILGTAMAHEVGHILLNMDGHSQTGIMQGNWDGNVLYDLACSRLYFTKGQEKVMQTEVARRALQRVVLQAANCFEAAAPAEQTK
jgi:hypothetical protein